VALLMIRCYTIAAPELLLLLLLGGDRLSDVSNQPGSEVRNVVGAGVGLCFVQELPVLHHIEAERPGCKRLFERLDQLLPTLLLPTLLLPSIPLFPPPWEERVYKEFDPVRTCTLDEAPRKLPGHVTALPRRLRLR
jgi:hypothetical protein